MQGRLAMAVPLAGSRVGLISGAGLEPQKNERHPTSSKFRDTENGTWNGDATSNGTATRPATSRGRLLLHFSNAVLARLAAAQKGGWSKRY
jgi:hypothetical protein